jgi:dihydrofolate reductase
MSKVIIHATMSLDGFIAKPDDELADWAFNYRPDEVVEEMMRNIGAVVLGKRSFIVSLEHDQLPYGGALKVPQFVVTHEFHQPERIGGLDFKFIVGGVDSAVELARQAAGEKYVSLLGANIAQQCLRAGLVDEIVIHLVPVLLGKGIPLFEGGLEKATKLEKLSSKSNSGMTSLKYRVVKE